MSSKDSTLVNEASKKYGTYNVLLSEERAARKQRRKSACLRNNMEYVMAVEEIYEEAQQAYVKLQLNLDEFMDSESEICEFDRSVSDVLAHLRHVKDAMKNWQI